MEGMWKTIKGLELGSKTGHEWWPRNRNIWVCVSIQV